jgi:hypothetical protein
MIGRHAGISVPAEGAKMLCAALAAVLLCASISGGVRGEEYLWPLKGNRRLSSSFSEYRDGHYHAGIDLRSYGNVGLPCIAVYSGYVARIKIGPAGYGKALYLRLSDGRTAVYAHLDQFDRAIDSLAWHYRVERGTNWCDFRPPRGDYSFAVGDTVGFSGQTGTSAPHLHFELRDGSGSPINPLLGIYDAPDRAAPIISGIEAVPIQEGSVTGDGPLPSARFLRASGSKRFVLPDTFQLDGVFGFGVSTWDEQGYGRFAMAPASVELAVDGQILYTVRNDLFSYSQAGEISAEYDVVGDGPAGRYLLLFPVRGGTRKDRFGEGIVHNGILSTGLSVEKGLHVGLITVRDAAGNSSTAIFHIAVHDFPVIETSRRLEAAPEVAASVYDPDGGDVVVRFFESFDGGRSWTGLGSQLAGGYYRASVADREDALYRVEATDDEGAVVKEWFCSPPRSLEKDMVFAFLEVGAGANGLRLEAFSDEVLLGTPQVRAAQGPPISLFRTGPLEYVAITGPGSARGGTAVFALSGIDYRGYRVDAAVAATVLELESGGRRRFLLADTIEAFLEAPSLRAPTPVIVGEEAMRPAAAAGISLEIGPFSLDFSRRNLSKPLRLHCIPGDKTGLFRWEEGKGWKCCGVPSMEGGYATVDRPGIYGFFSDRLPPEIKHVAVETNHGGSGFFKPYYCSVPVTEEGCGIDPWSASAFLGGDRVVCEWDEFRDVLIVPVPASFHEGRTVLAVEVSDRAGNRSVGEFGFVLE